MSVQGRMAKLKCRVSLDDIKPILKKKPEVDAVHGEVGGGPSQVIIEERVEVDVDPVVQGGKASCVVLPDPPEPQHSQAALKSERVEAVTEIVKSPVSLFKIRQKLKCRVSLDHLKPILKKKPEVDAVDGEIGGGPSQVIIDEQRVDVDPVVQGGKASCVVLPGPPELQHSQAALEPERMEAVTKFVKSPVVSFKIRQKLKCRIALGDLGMFAKKPKTEVEEECFDGRQVLTEELALDKIVQAEEENGDSTGAFKFKVLPPISSEAPLILEKAIVNEGLSMDTSADASVIMPHPIECTTSVNHLPSTSASARPKLNQVWVKQISHILMKSKKDYDTSFVPGDQVTFVDQPLEENESVDVLPQLPDPEIESSTPNILEWRSEMAPARNFEGNNKSKMSRISLDHLSFLTKEEGKVDAISVQEAVTEAQTLDAVVDVELPNENYYEETVTQESDPLPPSLSPEPVIVLEEPEMFPEMPSNPHCIKPENLLKEMWEKTKSLRLSSDDDLHFVFPDTDTILSTPITQIPDLMVLKGKLNETKSRLDHFPLQEWHYHTKQMNIANNIMTNVKRRANPEFSSQAWGKMFEILCNYDIIPSNIVSEADKCSTEGKEDTVPFNSIHLCEAPGAFVSALNHFLKISYPSIDWNWMATTLNPYHESNDVGKMINDDRRILMSMDHWTFLEDYTGNILSYPNLKHIVKERQCKLLDPRTVKTGKEQETVGLVTADGSIDCQINPSNQERMVAPLQFGEIVTALMLPHKGGTFILNIFTFLEATTICNLYLLSCVFKEVHLFKPVTSKEGNSEVYVICLQYLGKDSIRQILHKKLVPAIETYEDKMEKGTILFPLQSIPSFFMSRLQDAAFFFCNYQMKIIMRNISCFPCDTRVYEIMMKPAQRLASEHWIQAMGLEPLPSQDRLFIDEQMRKAPHVDERVEHGCFADKLQRKKGDHLTRLAYIKADLQAYKGWETPHNQTLFGGKFLIGNVRFERSYQNIRCSRFCTGRLLTDREEVREISKSYVKEMKMNGLNTMENVCMGHSIKRVFKSMAKSCDVILRDLEVMCFMKMTWDFVNKSDFEVQRNDLKILIERVKDLEKNRSLFLCRFPMLTRLQVGIIYCLTAVFEKVILYADPEKNVIGIMLHQFKGLSQPENKKLFHSIDDIMGAIEEDEFDRPVLEVVSVKTLLDFYPVEFVLNYNTLLNTQDLLRTVSVLEGIMQPILKMGPTTGQLTPFFTA